MKFFSRKASPDEASQDEHVEGERLEAVQPFHKAILPVFACGAGLFSDGYINNVRRLTSILTALRHTLTVSCHQVIGSVSTVLGYQYGETYANSNAKQYVGDIAFVGTVVGQLLFGYLSDHWSRTNSLLVSTVILIVFTALAAGSYYHGDAVGMFNILTAWRFFVSHAWG